MRLVQRAAAEGVGTALLLAAVVGSGIMADRLAGGSVALALLANAVATGGALVALILAFGPISGAHLNPAVTLADAWLGGLPWREVPAYVGAQLVGALGGVILAHSMFSESLFSLSHHARSGPGQVLSEAVATFGLLITILGCARSQPRALPFAVAAYITGAYWFTSSTSFANPAVTMARSLTDSFSGIRAVDVPAFVVAQLFGAFFAMLFFQWLNPDLRKSAARVVVPQAASQGQE